jgi:hypothetical protein
MPKREIGKELISTSEFYKNMLGRDRMWWHRHKHDPGMPKVLRYGRVPYIDYKEALAFVEKIRQGRNKEPGDKEGDAAHAC